MELEYMALSDAARQAIPQKWFFQELRVPSAMRSVPLLIDSQTALEISDNPVKYRQAKHIDVCYHAMHHYIYDDKIQIDYIPSAHQPADLFTKVLERTKRQWSHHMIGLWLYTIVMKHSLIKRNKTLYLYYLHVSYQKVF